MPVPAFSVSFQSLNLFIQYGKAFYTIWKSLTKLILLLKRGGETVMEISPLSSGCHGNTSGTALKASCTEGIQRKKVSQRKVNHSSKQSISMEIGHKCPYGEALGKPIKCQRTDGGNEFITHNNRQPRLKQGKSSVPGQTYVL